MKHQPTRLVRLFHAMALVLLLGEALPASAKAMDHGVDPANLGTGDWIYYISMATNRLGGNVDSVTDLASLMAHYQRVGVQFIAVKAGSGGNDFPSAARPQFNRELVEAAHAAGLKIFPYTRSNGKDVDAEFALVRKTLELGADGFILDAEAEWEAHRLENGRPKALDLCRRIKEAFPNTFLGHAPLPIISKHRSFPYREFGLHCDAVMPQAYWKSLRVSPTRMVEWMDEEWNVWHRSLTGSDTNAIKPLAPIGQGWSPSEQQIVTGEEILEFVAALNHSPRCASPTGYRGVSYWRTDLHTVSMWEGIQKARIGDLSSTPASLVRREPAAPPPSTMPSPETGMEQATPPVASVVLGNTSEGVLFTGAWYAGTRAVNIVGNRYQCANTSSSNATATAVYRPNLPKDGLYDIFVRYNSFQNRSRQAPWVIEFDGGTRTNRVNQTIDASNWRLLAGGVAFQAGTNGCVRISNATGEEQPLVVVADAVRWVWKGTNPGAQGNR